MMIFMKLGVDDAPMKYVIYKETTTLSMLVCWKILSDWEPDRHYLDKLNLLQIWHLMHGTKLPKQVLSWTGLICREAEASFRSNSCSGHLCLLLHHSDKNWQNTKYGKIYLICLQNSNNIAIHWSFNIVCWESLVCLLVVLILSVAIGQMVVVLIWRSRRANRQSRWHLFRSSWGRRVRVA